MLDRCARGQYAEKHMRILGIDPGLTTTGIGLLDVQGKTMTALDWLTLTTDPANVLTDRLRELSEDFEAILNDMRPDLAVVEQIFFANNAKTVLAVAHARGVLLATLGRRAIPVIEATPMQLKSVVTGDGSADKRQIGAMLCMMLHLPKAPAPADAADALALAVYGALKHSQPTH